MSGWCDKHNTAYAVCHGDGKHPEPRTAKQVLEEVLSRAVPDTGWEGQAMQIVNFDDNGDFAQTWVLADGARYTVSVRRQRADSEHRT